MRLGRAVGNAKLIQRKWETSVTLSKPFWDPSEFEKYGMGIHRGHQTKCELYRDNGRTTKEEIHLNGTIPITGSEYDLPKVKLYWTMLPKRLNNPCYLLSWLDTRQVLKVDAEGFGFVDRLILCLQ